MLGTTDRGATTAISLGGNEYANTISGNAGVNIIVGGAGLDTMWGGDGGDIFVWHSITEMGSTVIANSDTVGDFNAAILAGRPAHEPRAGVEQRSRGQPLRDLVPRARAGQHARLRVLGARAQPGGEALVRSGPDRDLSDRLFRADRADRRQVDRDRGRRRAAGLRVGRTSATSRRTTPRRARCSRTSAGARWVASRSASRCRGYWAQAFDDGLFAPDMAISMWRRAPNRSQHRLYLSMGGHAAPAADPAVEQDKLDAQMRFLDAVDAGPVPAGAERRLLDAGPGGPGARPTPTRTRAARGTGRPRTPGRRPASRRRRTPGGRRSARRRVRGTTLPLSPLTEDERNDPVAAAALSATPLGTAPLSAVPATNLPGFIASFVTPPFSSDRELSGAPSANLAWTPASPDSQLVLELFDEAPAGTLTLFSRGVAGLRGAVPGDGAAGARRRQHVQHPAPGRPPRPRLGDGR